jgi:tRNA threonylcarbamoyl adenosine modification protein YjeE
MKVTSPTYLLDNIYTYDTANTGQKTIHHFDLYRLPTGCNLDILGIPKIYTDSICLIEWPQRLGDNLPRAYLNVMITIEHHQSDTRLVTLTPFGQNWEKKLNLLTDSLFGEDENI